MHQLRFNMNTITPLMHVMLLLTNLVCVGTLYAQDKSDGGAYPNRPVRMVVPFPPGSPSDILSRVISDPLSQRLGRPVVIENRAGAGGLSGVEAVATAAPDGYTLVLGGTGALAISPSLRESMPYNVARDFAPIGLAATMPQMLVVGLQVPVSTVNELIAYVKARPGQLNYASGGPGSVAHLAGEMFKSAAGLDATHIPYRAGTPAAVTEIIAGRIQFMYSGITVLLPYVKSGRIKGIAVAANARSALAPNLPTVIESGLPDFTVEVWVGLLAPAKTPPAVIARVNRDLVALLKAPEVRERMLGQGAEPVGGTPDEFRAYIAREADKWQRIIRAANIREE